MKILHHNDDDGRCAAYIVKEFIAIPGITKINIDDFIEYGYTGDLAKKYPNVNDGEKVYIVDISLCDAVLGFIRHCISNGAMVIHIDHHHTTFSVFNEHKKELEGYFREGKYTYFFKEGISGAMLTWIFSDVFGLEHRKNPMNVNFDFREEERIKCALLNDDNEPIDKFGNLLGENGGITVPEVIRYIDDNDVWRHKIKETKAFTEGLKLVKEKHPLSEIWSVLFDITINAEIISSIISDGAVILKYEEQNNYKNLYNGFYVNMFGAKVCFLNTISGNSTIFQELYDYSDAVCKYSYDGTKYTYTFYSKDDGASVCDIINKLKTKYGDKCGFLNGGGHVHAAGCSFTKNFLEEFEIDKNTYIRTRKQIRYDKEIKAETERLEEEEKKLREEQAKLEAIKAKVAARMADNDDDEDYGI